jgi:predicted Rossmann-fold nucleotide-binding protein
MLTWPRLGLHAKPCGILNTLGCYSPLLAMLDHVVEERFLKPENRALVLARHRPSELLASTGGVTSGAGRKMAGDCPIPC